MVVRKAHPTDVARIHALILELAIYEKMQEEVVNTVDQLCRDLFEHKLCEAIVLEDHGEIMGFALFYTSYSTWKGACLYLEDLYIVKARRRKGLGSKLFEYLVNLARERNYARMDWQVLKWNTPAIRFYEKYGAEMNDEWMNGRLHFSALA